MRNDKKELSPRTDRPVEIAPSVKSSFLTPPCGYKLRSFSFQSFESIVQSRILMPSSAI
ncbi:hypothetical protein NYE48_15080 [Paenibacillus sp. FSL M7-1455]|jgi:hypothetical protein|uniref:hypothetical protein n=1 Tax=Paenibacillus sp. FSL M7-1455 TaxID=2975316 RepID=UPI0030FCBDBD